MQWSDIQFKPTHRTLRQFAGLFLIIFGGLAVYETVVSGVSQLAMAYGIAAVAVGGTGLIFPKLIQPIFVGWSIVAFPIGWLVSAVMLGVLYYGVFTPIGVAFRLFGRDALALRRRQVTSYWQPKPVAVNSREYFRQS